MRTGGARKHGDDQLNRTWSQPSSWGYFRWKCARGLRFLLFLALNNCRLVKRQIHHASARKTTTEVCVPEGHVDVEAGAPSDVCRLHYHLCCTWRVDSKQPAA